MNSRSLSHSKETQALLDWYDANARQLAWRISPDQTKRGIFQYPYNTWLSEIMLQQTQVKTVDAYYRKFIRRWPSLNELAASDLEDVLKMWAGLGYYSRARNLKKCADLIAGEYGGEFPATAKELRTLPGIGAYTSAAIAAISFGEKIAVIDGNVERVMARRHEIATSLPTAKKQIGALVGLIVPKERPGDFAQAMMDLGATVCTPKNPACIKCPWQDNCGAYANSRQNFYPVKPPKKAKPLRRTAGFVLLNTKGQVFLRKRPQSVMLAQMSEIPSGDWSLHRDGAMGIDAAPIKAGWKNAGTLRHAFTHFSLEMKVYCCVSQNPPTIEGWWVAKESVMDEALPSLMKKAIRLALVELKKGK